MSESEVRVLLDRLCVVLGFCLPPAEATRIARLPPQSVIAFTEAVFRAEGMDPLTCDRTLFRQVRDLVAEAFAQSAGARSREEGGTEGEPTEVQESEDDGSHRR